MFDASFPEIVLILLVALIVIGPERLPKVARTIGFWVGRARSMFNGMRNEVEREIQLDELRQAERDLKKDLDMNRDLLAEAEKGKTSNKGAAGKSRSASGGAATGQSGARAATSNKPVAPKTGNKENGSGGDDDGSKA